MAGVDLGWIEAAAPPGVTAGDSFEGAPGAAEGAVFFDGIQGVLGAGGVVAAVAAHESAEGGAVEEDEIHEDVAHRFLLWLFGLPGGVELEEEVAEEFLIFRQQHRLVGADDEDEVVALWQVVLVEAEGFAEEAF